jgi:hypothetical protein
MKLLRNPIFTAGLVIVAVAVVFYQFMGPRLRFGRPANLQVNATQATTVTKPAPRSVPKLVGVGLLLTNKIDREFAELHFDGWVEWPQRDPFLLLTPDPDELSAITETNSPVPTWKLRALWAQTGSRLAVINHGTYREGDEIEGYRIDKIDTGGVWFIGPREKERLGFDTRPRPPATNSPQPVVSPPPVMVQP